MPLYKTINYKEVKIGVWKVTETLLNLSNLHPCGKDLLQEVSERFKSESRKLEWLAVRVLLYTLTKDKEYIAYQANGRPYLKSNHYQISISHTQGYVAVILHPQSIVGIDIERISERVRKVASRFVSTEEMEAIKDDSVLPLLLHWCAKETVFKMMNQAEVDLLEHLHVTNFVYPADLNFCLTESRTSEQNKYELNGMIDPDFVMTWSIFS